MTTTIDENNNNNNNDDKENINTRTQTGDQEPTEDEQEERPSQPSTDNHQPKKIETTPTNNETEPSASTSKSDPTLIKLIGNNVPSIPLEVLKRNPHSKDPSPSAPKWIWAPIDHPARKDGLKLNHWVRTDDQEVYRFAKYDTTSNVFSYTTEEYYHLLRDDDWTKAETDYLFNLLNTYDLRFPVVHDRYEFVGSHERTLDDLKARYYSICQKLIPHRPSTSSTSTHLDDPNKKQLIQSYHFDKQREVERKKHVKSLLNRTPAQLQQEEFIYIETRRLEQNLLKRIRNRDEVMKIIGGFQHHILNEMKFWPIVEPSPTTLQLSRLAISNSINNNLNSANNPSGFTHPPESTSRSAHLNQLDKRNARREDTTMDDLPINASSGGLVGDNQEMNGERPKGIDPQEQIEHDTKHCIYRLDSNSLTGSTTGSGGHHRTVCLRSARIPLPKTAAAQTRISTVWSELNIPNLLSYLPKPLIMPTRKNVESYERLIQATNQLIDLKRLIDRVDNDLKVHRKKKDSLLATLSTSSTHPTSPAKIELDNPPARPPQPNPAIESNPEDPSLLGPDPPKTTTNKKRSASVCSSSSSCSSTVGSTTHHQQHQQHPKSGSQSSRKKIRKN
ncbi:swr complex subunit [Puccinia graminis f. sp. tritici]|uniref:SWR1-complex protein 4 n=1 Tax=Puccinia graminis f. sp. tritici TaxID=56615 RepID=A0A5B0QD66_PUCGR|nr:swr complex subunit [Puccinia graminis f. sp. tritici]